MQQLDRKEPIGSLSAALGPTLQQLAMGLGSQLQQRRQRQHNAMGLQSLGIPEAQANFMSEMDPQLQQIGLKQKLLEPSRQANWDLYNQLFGGGNQQPNTQGANPQQLSSMATDQQSSGMPSSSGMPQAINNQPQPIQQGGMSAGMPSGMPRSNLGAKGQMSDNDLRTAVQLQMQQQNMKLKQDIAEQHAFDKEADRDLKLELAGIDSENKKKERLLREKLAIDKKQNAKEVIDKKEVNKFYQGMKDESQQISKNLANNEADIRDLNTLEGLNRTGQLIQGGKRGLLEKFGWQDVYTNAPTNLASKIIATLNIRGIGNIQLGGKFTNEYLKSIQRQNPNLLDTQDGFDAVIKNKKIELSSDDLIKKAEKSELSKYKKMDKIPPEDWREQAHAKVAKQLDANGERLLENAWKTYYKDAGIKNPKQIYSDFPVKNEKEGRHIMWHNIPHELSKGKWLPVPGWNKGDPNVYAESLSEQEINRINSSQGDLNA